MAQNSEGLPVKLTVGKCGWSPVKGLKCTCEAGQYISTTRVFNRNIECVGCAHPFSVHGGFVKEPLQNNEESGTFQIYRGSQHSQRNKAIQKLADLIEEERFVHVRGTPSPGKTTLAKLLRDYYTVKREPVVFIDDWSTKTSPVDHIRSKCRFKGHGGRHSWDLALGTDLIFILDEAEHTFADSYLWWGVVKENINMGFRGSTRFCIFSSYGDPTAGSPLHDFPETITPPMIPPWKRVSLALASPSRYNRKTPDICLFYDLQEYNKVVDKHCKDCGFDYASRKNMEFNLHPDVREYIFSLTSGHPGAVHSLLEYICLFYSYGSYLKREGVTLITMDHVRAHLDDDRRLCKFLQGRSVVGKSLPSETTGVRDPNIIDVLLKILKDGSVKYTTEITWPLITVSERGLCMLKWLIKMFVLTSWFVCFPLHYMHSSWNIHTAGPTLPSSQLTNIPNPRTSAKLFFGASLNRTYVTLGMAVEWAYQAKKDPPETAFRDEFYRSLLDKVPGAGIASNWLATEQGCVDYWIPDPGWRIELLHDGDGLEECCGRFRDDTLKDWLILDCRHSVPETTCRIHYPSPVTRDLGPMVGTDPNEPRLWRVVVENDYSRIRILDCEKMEMMDKTTRI